MYTTLPNLNFSTPHLKHRIASFERTFHLEMDHDLPVPAFLPACLILQPSSMYVMYVCVLGQLLLYDFGNSQHREVHSLRLRCSTRQLLLLVTESISQYPNVLASEGDIRKQADWNLMAFDLGRHTGVLGEMVSGNQIDRTMAAHCLSASCANSGRPLRWLPGMGWHSISNAQFVRSCG